MPNARRCIDKPMCDSPWSHFADNRRETMQVPHKVVEEVEVHYQKPAVMVCTQG